MPLPRRTALALSLALLAAPATVGAMEVDSRHDPDADFGTFHTFDHQARPETAGQSAFAAGSDYDRRMREILDKRFGERGFERTEGEPDFLVAYSFAREEHLDPSGARRQVAPGLSIAWEEGDLVRAYTEGSLMIEVVDAGSGETVWAGWATEVLDDPDRLLQQPDRLMKEIDKAVRRIIKRFPPDGR